MELIISKNESSGYYLMMLKEILSPEIEEIKMKEVISFLEEYYNYKASFYIIGSLVRTKEGIEIHVTITEWDGLQLCSKDKATLEEIQPEIEKLLDK